MTNKKDFFNSNNFDYVIIGGTPAGAYLASKLSEDKNINVCYLTASNDTDLKQLYYHLRNKERFDQFETNVNENLYNRRTSLKNEFVFNPALIKKGCDSGWSDFELAGAQEFSFEEVSQSIDEAQKNMEEYVSFYMNNDIKSAQYSFNNLFSENKLNHIGDVNRYGQYNEQYSYEDLLVGSLIDRPNLTVIKNAHIRVLSMSNNKVFGAIYYQADNEPKIVRGANTLLCAGPILNSLILLRSGIGNKKELEKNQIKVVSDVKNVGKNLRDYPTTQLAFSMDGISLPKYKKSDVVNAWKYSYKNNFPLAKFNNMLLAGYVCSNHKKIIADNMVSVSSDVRFKEFGYYYPQSSISILVSLLNIQSLGKVTLNSKNPLVRGSIDPNYFESPTDMKNMVRSVKNIFDKFMQFDYANSDKKLLGSKLTPVSDYEWEKFIKSNTYSIGQVIGGCQIGRSYNNEAVVDHNLDVNGVTNLKICDHSIIKENIFMDVSVTSLAIGSRALALLTGGMIAKDIEKVA